MTLVGSWALDTFQVQNMDDAFAEIQARDGDEAVTMARTDVSAKVAEMAEGSRFEIRQDGTCTMTMMVENKERVRHGAWGFDGETMTLHNAKGDTTYFAISDVSASQFMMVSEGDRSGMAWRWKK